MIRYFLVDRSNLGRQTLKEFQQFRTPEEHRPFTELYNVQRMQSNKLDDVSKVCITTIQRLDLHGLQLHLSADQARWCTACSPVEWSIVRSPTFPPEGRVTILDLSDMPGSLGRDSWGEASGKAGTVFIGKDLDGIPMATKQSLRPTRFAPSPLIEGFGSMKGKALIRPLLKGASKSEWQPKADTTNVYTL